MARQTREEFMFGTEPIEAWRLWDIDSIAGTLDGGMERFVRAMALASRRAPDNPWEYMLQPRLSAIARADSSWEPRDPQPAACTSVGSHAAPHLDCECGYWALKTAEAASQHYLDSYSGSADAVGRVNLWGRFCEFEKGYRAEYAYPAEVWLIGKKANGAMAARLADAYGIPVYAEEPGFMAVERDRRTAARKESGEGLLVSSYQALLNQMWHTKPLTFSSWYGGANVELSAGWPDGIVRPSELMGELKKQGLWQS